jgi:hypothetical protein
MLRVFGPKRDEVPGKWRKLHNEELCELYSSPTILRVIKSRRMRWAGHVARMGRGEVCTGFWWGNPRERDQWGDPGIDGAMILRWLFKKYEQGTQKKPEFCNKKLCIYFRCYKFNLLQSTVHLMQCTGLNVFSSFRRSPETLAN